jgi:monolysocardiolipin acyltransferase
MRWVASDAINFFVSGWKAWVFTAGKCVPIVRGAGVDQEGFYFLRDRLAEGAWVHIFPEGGRTRDPLALMRTPFKLGVGRLIDEARPIALPFYHYGMQGVLPVGSNRPRTGQRVRLLFGESTSCDETFLATVDTRLESRNERARWEALSQWAYGELRSLEIRVHPAAREEHAVGVH